MVYCDTPRRKSIVINLQWFRADRLVSSFLPLPVPPSSQCLPFCCIPDKSLALPPEAGQCGGMGEGDKT